VLNPEANKVQQQQEVCLKARELTVSYVLSRDETTLDWGLDL
jgi:hypothetical protein